MSDSPLAGLLEITRALALLLLVLIVAACCLIAAALVRTYAPDWTAAVLAVGLVLLAFSLRRRSN